MTIQREGDYVHDIVASEYDKQYCREVVTLKNTTGGTISLANTLGLPVKLLTPDTNEFEFITAADAGTPANIDALVIENKPITGLANTATAPGTYVVLRRGPAMVIKDKLAVEDHTGYTFDADEVALGLADLGIKAVPLHEVSAYQDF